MTGYKNPALTVDMVVIRDARVLLIKRKNDPFKDHWALPGGFVDYGEMVEAAAVRELFEETSLKTESVMLFGVYSAPDRDPRGHTVSIVFKMDTTGEPKAGDDAS